MVKGSSVILQELTRVIVADYLVYTEWRVCIAYRHCLVQSVLRTIQ